MQIKTKKPESFSLAQARRLILRAQLLDGKAGLPPGKEGAAQIVERLGYVQIDTIAVVQRAHHHTLWTRCPDYEPTMLDELLAQDRRVFEYWAHASSYVPMSDYRYYRPRMHSLEDPHSKWDQQRLENYGHLMGPVLERVRQEGALGPRDFPKPTPEEARRLGGHPHPAKAALEMLHLRGALMVAERRSFERIYDLTERVLPADVDTSMPDGDEVGRFFVKRALSAGGLAREREIQDHIDAVPKEVLSTALADLVAEGEIIPLHVEGLDGDYYGFAGAVDAAAQLGPLPADVHLLSPFDNLVAQREHIRRLFDFDYALECYKTPAKRQYGYFVLPILWGERFVGRLDPKVDRKKRLLLIRNLIFEEAFGEYGDFLPSFAQKLDDFAQFNGCTRIQLERTSPFDIKDRLAPLLA